MKTGGYEIRFCEPPVWEQSETRTIPWFYLDISQILFYAFGIMKKGRPKGYSPYAEITYGELGDWLGRKSLVKVSKAWLEELTNHAVSVEHLCDSSSTKQIVEEVKEEQPKIEFKLTNLNDE